ncbi:hypothetical protein EGW08_000595 [Elysia chlorotica]|uniref:Uncharacterized protein n=1 Tax=Elysia chlorotica TaxID=188477 RepID=A0A3S1BUK5_ELYCH|nr:hypothetical protein EGW08_000595 [Elysia chlorotica]
MRLPAGGGFCIRLSFCLILTAVTVINLITLFSTDLLRHQRDGKRLGHQDSISFQQETPELAPNTVLDFQFVPRSWKQSDESSASLIKKSPELREDEGNSLLAKETKYGTGFNSSAVKDKISEFNSDTNLKQVERNSRSHGGTDKGPRLKPVEKLPNIIEHDLGLEDFVKKPSNKSSSSRSKKSSPNEGKNLTTGKTRMDIRENSKDSRRSDIKSRVKQGEVLPLENTVPKKKEFIERQNSSIVRETKVKKYSKVLDQVAIVSRSSSPSILPSVLNQTKKQKNTSELPPPHHDKAMPKSDLSRSRGHVPNRSERMGSEKVEKVSLSKHGGSNGTVSCEKSAHNLRK